MIERIIKRANELIAEVKTHWHPYFEELAYYYYPNRKGFTSEQSPGNDRFDDLWTEIPQVVVRSLCGGVVQLIHPADRMWINIAASEENRKWAQQTSLKVYNKIYDMESFFPERNYEYAMDLVTFGTAVMYIDYDRATKKFSFQVVNLKDVVFSVNPSGKINYSARSVCMTLGQMMDKFDNEKLSHYIRENTTNGKVDTHKKIDILHVVMERSDYLQEGGDKSHFPFVSLWIDPKEKKVLSKGGFYTFPYVVTRWESVTKEVMGRCPAMMGLSTARLANAVEAALLESIEKQANPPLLYAADIIPGDIEMWPGGATAYESQGFAFQGDPLKPVQLGKNIPMTTEYLEAIHARLERIFYADVFSPRMRSKEPIDALAERQLMIKQIYPVLANIEDEWSGGIMKRCIDILVREGEIDPHPDGEMVFDFDNPLQDMMREYQANKSFLAVMNIAQIQNEAVLGSLFENIDLDKFIRGTLSDTGMNLSYLKDVEEMMEARQQREMMMQAQQAAEIARNAAPAVKAAGDVQKSANETGLMPSDDIRQLIPQLGNMINGQA